MYEKLSDTYGKAEALFRTKQSGLFAADLFKGSTVESISVDARKEVEKILKESGDKTKDRRSLTESAYTYNIDLAAKVDKESLQKSISEIEKLFRIQQKSGIYTSNFLMQEQVRKRLQYMPLVRSRTMKRSLKN